MSFNFMAAVTLCSDFGAQKRKSDVVSTSVSYEVMGPDAMIFVSDTPFFLAMSTDR